MHSNVTFHTSDECELEAVNCSFVLCSAFLLFLIIWDYNIIICFPHSVSHLQDPRVLFFLSDDQFNKNFEYLNRSLNIKRPNTKSMFSLSHEFVLSFKPSATFLSHELKLSSCCLRRDFCTNFITKGTVSI